MKKILIFCLLLMVAFSKANAQCATANINWDNLDFLISTGNYATFVTDAKTRDQYFAFGPRIMRIQTSANITISGENTTHTGETGGYGTGVDAAFTTTSVVGTTLTLSFPSTQVTGLRFSLFDIDNSQRVTVTASNGVVPVSTTLSLATGSSGITFAANPGTAPTAIGIAGSYTSTDNRGTVNVDIPAAVTTVTITLSTATGDFWLSDLQACVYGSFATNFHTASQPWPGQPSYISATSDTNLVHMVDPATGAAKILFQDPAYMYLNAMGYDPNNKQMFYVPDDTVVAVVQTGLKKYDFNTETIVTVLPDIRTIGIPLFSGGVESAAGSFYDSAYYIGIEGGNNSNNSARESIIWRIEMDASNNPIAVCQVMAMPADNGSGSKSHDWGDFVVSNGILYDWDTGNQGTTRNIFHYNLQTGNMDATYSPGTPSGFVTPRQVGVTWDNRIFYASSYIARYNGAGTFTGGNPNITGPGWITQPGDAGEAFRPKADYGDAPSIYDPVASPAVHERDTALRLGATFDREWLKEGSTPTADSDGADEDALSTVPILCPCSGNFLIPVRVYNNTGATATLIAWLDYDGDGAFEASEAQTATVNSSSSLQTINLSWTNAWSFLPDNSITYLRVRLTSAANGMTTSTPSGYFVNGEVEDYRVLVDGFPLAVNIASFTAATDGCNDVQLNWKVMEDATLSHYYIQKSSNGRNWINLSRQEASGQNASISYHLQDASIQSGTVYYRLQLVYHTGHSMLSDVRQVSLGTKGSFSLAPNPAVKQTILSFIANEVEVTSLSVYNSAGGIIQSQKVRLTKGANSIMVDVSLLAKGLYTIQMKTNKGIISETFVKN